MYIYLRCIVNKLKKISKMSTLPPWKNFCGRSCLVLRMCWHCNKYENLISTIIDIYWCKFNEPDKRALTGRVWPTGCGLPITYLNIKTVQSQEVYSHSYIYYVVLFWDRSFFWDLTKCTNVKCYLLPVEINVYWNKSIFHFLFSWTVVCFAVIPKLWPN